ncbi:MAG: hypothetical protein AB1Z98_19235 [Nannocystaceae bacterium]
MPARSRGATLISVLLLVLALTTLALLGLRSSGRDLRSAGSQVARERAWHSAAAVVALAQVRLQALSAAQLDAVLTGSLPQGPGCDDPCRDCIPAGVELTTELPLPTCVAPPCSRPGAVARLLDQAGATPHWCRVPLRQLMGGGDTDARVSVWVRNDSADALDGGGWSHDDDRRVVLTAVAEVRGTRVVLEERVALAGG